MMHDSKLEHISCVQHLMWQLVFRFLSPRDKEQRLLVTVYEVYTVYGIRSTK
jgi:hypothetical protein